MHPLRREPVIRAIEAAVSSHRGRAWTVSGFTDLDDRASHPAGILDGPGFAVFAKLDTTPERFTAELCGLTLLRPYVATPDPVSVVEVAGGAVLLLEAVAEVPAAARSLDQWRSLGYALAGLHQVHAEAFGLTAFDGYFGPLHQDNQPVRSNRWADFYATRRLLPRLRSAVDSGRLPGSLAAGVERVAGRLPSLVGPEPRPTLLHGDAQQNNLLTTATSAVLVDAAPYFGHPEIDLALVDYFSPVPAAVFQAYAEVTPIDAGFMERRELWRLFGYLAVITVDGASAFGRPFLDRIAAAVARYR